MVRYLLKAFLNRWNILFLGAGAAFAFISGSGGVLLPIVVAVELLSISFVAANSRFQAAVDRETRNGEPAPEMTSERVNHILNRLKKEDREKFLQLKQSCTQLRRLGKPSSEDPDLEGVADAQFAGLNRLLWIYLKLLQSKNGLDQFFQTTNRNTISKQIDEIRKKLSVLGPPENDDLDRSRKRESLADTLSTYETRLENFDKVHEQYELILLELDRLRAKTTSLAEMGISHQDLGTIQSDVDATAFSVRQATGIINELSSFTGVSFHEETPLTLIEKW